MTEIVVSAIFCAVPDCYSRLEWEKSAAVAKFARTVPPYVSRSGVRLLRKNGWRFEHGKWVCDRHEVRVPVAEAKTDDGAVYAKVEFPDTAGLLAVMPVAAPLHSEPELHGATLNPPEAEVKRFGTGRRRRQFTYVQHAGDREVFAPDAFDGTIGQTVRVTFRDVAYEGTVVAARVARDGRSATFTLDLPDEVPEDLTAPRRRPWWFLLRPRRAPRGATL